jgi:hypothetical protein
MSFFDKMKKASKSVVDAGAKTMLKVGHHESFCISDVAGSRLVVTRVDSCRATHVPSKVLI